MTVNELAGLVVNACEARAGGLNIRLLKFTRSEAACSLVTVTAVPEPSASVMLAIAGGIAAFAARRRQKA